MTNSESQYTCPWPAVDCQTGGCPQHHPDDGTLPFFPLDPKRKKAIEQCFEAYSIEMQLRETFQHNAPGRANSRFIMGLCYAYLRSMGEKLPEGAFVPHQEMAMDNDDKKPTTSDGPLAYDMHPFPNEPQRSSELAQDSTKEGVERLTTPAMKEEEHDKSTCDHGVTFDLKEAKKMMAETPHDNSDPVNFIMGSPAHDQIRKRWPRLDGLCPKGCGYRGIAYASMDHLRYGDW